MGYYKATVEVQIMTEEDHGVTTNTTIQTKINTKNGKLMYGPELWPEQPTQNIQHTCPALSTSFNVCIIESIVMTIMVIVAFHTDHLPES